MRVEDIRLDNCEVISILPLPEYVEGTCTSFKGAKGTVTKVVEPVVYSIFLKCRGWDNDAAQVYHYIKMLHVTASGEVVSSESAMIGESNV